MNKPTTYIDGLNRERCSATGKEVERCQCAEHRPKKQAKQKKAADKFADKIAQDAANHLTRRRSSRIYRAEKFEVPKGVRIPQPGDVMDVVNHAKGEDLEIEIVEVHSVEWADDSRDGVIVDMSYYILESTMDIKPGKKMLH